jgi:hypothetical protein
MVVYNKNGVYIAHGQDFRFGAQTIRTKSSSSGGDTLISGLHGVIVKRNGVFSSESSVVLSFYDGTPDKTVWSGSSSEAESIASAIRTVTGCS